LKASDKWKEDGPSLPIEFARVSSGPRLTLVLCKGAENLPTLWTISASKGIQEAIINLAKRETTNIGNIGFLFIPDDIYRCNVVPDCLSIIRDWAEQKNLDAVIWTDLPPIGVIPNPEEVIKLISGFSEDGKKLTEEYVRRTPPQMRTKIRKALEEKFGWTPSSQPIGSER
jgi:hypothetical protein